MEKGTPKSPIAFRWLYLEALALFIYLFIGIICLQPLFITLGQEGGVTVIS